MRWEKIPLLITSLILYLTTAVSADNPIYDGNGNPTDETLNTRGNPSAQSYDPQGRLETNLPPFCIVKPSFQSGVAPYEARLDASESYDPEGDPLTFYWTAGDGSKVVANGPIFTHNYTTIGAYYGNVVCSDQVQRESHPWAGFEVCVKEEPEPTYRMFLPFISNNYRPPRPPPCSTRWATVEYVDRIGRTQVMTLTFQPVMADVQSVGVLPYGRHVDVNMVDDRPIDKVYRQGTWYEYYENLGPHWGFFGSHEQDRERLTRGPDDIWLKAGPLHLIGFEYYDYEDTCLAGFMIEHDP